MKDPLSHPKYPELTRLVKAILVLPHGNADVERGFSQTSNYLTNNRTCLSEASISAIQSTKDGLKHYNYQCHTVPFMKDFVKNGCGAHKLYLARLEEEKRIEAERKKQEQEDKDKIKQQSTEVLNCLSRALKLFKLTEFKSIVLPLFEEITWSEVKKRIVKEKKTFTVQSLTDLLINQVKRLEVDELLARVHNLQLLEKAVHPERVIWKAVYLEQGEGRFCTKWSAKFFQQELKRKCTTNNLSTAVKETFGADYIKKCNLSGRDIKSLYQMLKNKENSAFNTRSVVLNNQTFTRVVHPERTLHGLDFSRTNDRRRYIKSLLGDNPPVVQRLEIEVQ
uniref:HAT C-terminal dimerisation domain-containing protein n=1 Tax=Timema shepardi TaxID=629360 RepID=A0A7R9B3Z6_TIMSH|nr:unnamed protein product [Timema shepardi]